MSYPDAPSTPTESSWPDPRQAPDRAARPLATDKNIQGNVLAGFNKDHQLFFFLHLPSPDVGRQWIADFLPKIATNNAVRAFNERFSGLRHSSGKDPDLFAVWINLSLTAPGIALLDQAAVDDIRSHSDLDAGVQAWIAGAHDLGNLAAVGDGSTEGWVFGTAAPEVHIVVCLAADLRRDLDLEANRLREQAALRGVQIIFEQPGATLPGPSAGHEHFGFKDGISQPGVSGFDEPNDPDDGQVRGKLGTDLIAAGTFVLGYPRDAGAAVRVPAWMFDGSFLVTRRLAQDVPAFWDAVEQQHRSYTDAQVHDPSTGIPTADALAARLVGRWRSGTPADHAPVSDNRSAQDPSHDNDFDFEDDQPGDRTPGCAHIRKVYPREGALDTLTEDDTKMRRILRRGIPFGPAFEPTAGRGHGVDAERGLVFQCYQSSLADQFVFLQQTWVNNESFPHTSTGRDPIIGIGGAANVRGAGQDVGVVFGQFLHTEGTVYSLTPSMPTLRAVADGKSLTSLVLP
jgi:Dyp-type peroxidase family